MRITRHFISSIIKLARSRSFEKIIYIRLKRREHFSLRIFYIPVRFVLLYFIVNQIYWGK